MKNLISILLALLMMLTPVSAFQRAAAVQIDNPKVAVEYVYHDDSWWSLMNDYGLSNEALTTILSEHYIIGDVTFDRALWLDCAPIDGPITFTFSQPYAEYEYVCCILLNKPYTYISFAYGNEDGTVTFMFNDIPSDIYLMLVFSGWKVD